MKAQKGALVAVDGVDGTAVTMTARAALTAAARARRGGVSVWDASGVFGDLAVASTEAGAPSARTLLLLYAADLAFRLRWELRPALAEGRVVIAAPYVDTAIAFGRAAGIRGGWLTDLFGFAPRPTESRYVDSAPVRSVAHRVGFIEFGCEHIVGRPPAMTRQQLVDRARAHLQAAARRRGGRASQ